MNMVALVDGQPRLLNLKQFLQFFLQHRREVVVRRTRYDLIKARDRGHILEGLAVALSNVDEIIILIKASASPAEAKAALMERTWRSTVVEEMLRRALAAPPLWILFLALGLNAGGVPLSAVIGKAEIMDAPVVGGLGGTFAGSPLACAAGLAVLEVIEKEKLNQRAEQLGAKLASRLRQMQAKFPCIGEVRALGMMVAIELVKNRRADLPDAELTRAVVQAAGRRGLILLSCGLYSNVIRILAPLTIPEAQLEEGLGLLEESLAEASTGAATAVA